MSKISHVELNVSDYARSIRFYDLVLGALGWRRLVCQKSHTTFTDGLTKIVLCPTEERFVADGYHRKRTGLNHLAFYADTKAQVDHLHAEILEKNNIACLYEEKPSGEDHYYAVFFEDPDRFKVEVVYSPGYCGPGHWTNQLDDDFDPYTLI